MTRARVAAVFAVLAVAACQVLVGIDNHELVVRDAGIDAAPPADGATADAAPSDPCAHVVPPPPPPDAFDDVNGAYFVALRTVDYSGTDDAGAPLGYDLDGVCTCEPGSGTAHGGGASCSPPAPQTRCDYEGGVDNALARLWKVYGSQFPTDAAAGPNTPFECGRETLLIYISEYNGTPNDSQVKVGLLASYGIRTPHGDGGAERDAGCFLALPDGGANGGPPYPAQWDGTDVWTFSSSSALLRDGALFPAAITDQAYVTDSTLVVPVVDHVPFYFAGQGVEISSPLVVAKLIPVNGPGGPGLRVNGVLAGRLASSALLTAVGNLNPRASAAKLCNQSGSDLLKSVLCGSVDILSNPQDDFRDHPDASVPYACDAISVALRFTGEPALRGDPYDPPDAGDDAGCDPQWAVCPPL